MNWYIILAIIGFLTSAALYICLVKKVNYSLKLSVFLGLASLTGLFAGGRFFGIIASKIYYYNTGISIVPGIVFYGGLLGFLAVFITLQKIAFKSISGQLCDIIAVVIPLFHSFGRIGCFLTGCCGGIVHVQLIESFCNFLLFLLLLFLFNKKIFNGRLLYVYLLIYPLYRFLIEFLRTDIERGMIGEFSFGQVCSIGIFIFAVVMLIINKKNKVE